MPQLFISLFAVQLLLGSSTDTPWPVSSAMYMYMRPLGCCLTPCQPSIASQLLDCCVCVHMSWDSLHTPLVTSSYQHTCMIYNKLLHMFISTHVHMYMIYKRLLHMFISTHVHMYMIYNKLLHMFISTHVHMYMTYNMYMQLTSTTSV